MAGKQKKAAAATAVVYVGAEERVQLSPYGAYPGGDFVVRGEKFTTTAEHAKGLLESANWQPASAARNEKENHE